MYFTSKLGPDRDVWMSYDAGKGSDKAIWGIQRAVDDSQTFTTASLASRLALALFTFSFAVLSITLLIAKSLNGWRLDWQVILPPSLIAAGCAFALIGSISVICLIRRFNIRSLQKEINTTRAYYVTAQHYSFNQLFRSDNKWSEMTNLAYCATPQIVDDYFRTTHTADMVIQRSGQDVKMLKLGIQKLAEVARKACTADATNHKQEEADLLKQVDFKPLYDTRDVK